MALSIVVDRETGVNYLVNVNGITPLLDHQGNVIVDAVVTGKETISQELCCSYDMDAAVILLRL